MHDWADLRSSSSRQQGGITTTTTTTTPLGFRPTERFQMPQRVKREKKSGNERRCKAGSHPGERDSKRKSDGCLAGCTAAPLEIERRMYGIVSYRAVAVAVAVGHVGRICNVETWKHGSLGVSGSDLAYIWSHLSCQGSNGRRARSSAVLRIRCGKTKGAGAGRRRASWWALCAHWVVSRVCSSAASLLHES